MDIIWSQEAVDSRKIRMIVCIFAVFMNSIFWIQLIFCSSLRQKSMQWIYAYIITDDLLLLRFFFLYIVHTQLTDCSQNGIWFWVISYIETTLDNYLNVLQVYILFALNVCRYIQIVRNINVYTVHKKLLFLSHLAIYLLPLIVVVVPIVAGWTLIKIVPRDACFIYYKNVGIEIFNIIFTFALPIFSNIMIIYACARHIHLTSTLKRTKNFNSVRDKYHRTLVIQFLIFYTIWVLLWSPNIIIVQVSMEQRAVADAARLLNFIEIALDPIIIGALDIRFWNEWKKIAIRIKHVILFNRFRNARIAPLAMNANTNPIENPRKNTNKY